MSRHRHKSYRLSRNAPGNLTQAAAGKSELAGEKRPVFKFVLIFGTCLAVSYAISALGFFQVYLFPKYLEWNARVSATILGWIGQDHVNAVKSVIVSPGFGIEVARGCDAVESTALFVCAVVASPVARRAKLAGVAVGALCLMIMNLFRVVTLFLIGLYLPRTFHVMHIDVWQVIFILLAVILWVAWARWALMREVRSVSA